MRGYHCTKLAGHIDTIKPVRMDSVYMFQDLADACRFLAEFGYDHILLVEFQSADVLRRWRAKYGHVVRLKPGRNARVLETI